MSWSSDNGNEEKENLGLDPNHLNHLFAWQF